MELATPGLDNHLRTALACVPKVDLQRSGFETDSTDKDRTGDRLTKIASFDVSLTGSEMGVYSREGVYSNQKGVIALLYIGCA